MIALANALGINRPYRTQAQARAIVGFSIEFEGAQFTCESFNDLGALYWRSNRDGKLYCGRTLDDRAKLAGAAL